MFVIDEQSSSTNDYCWHSKYVSLSLSLVSFSFDFKQSNSKKQKDGSKDGWIVGRKGTDRKDVECVNE
jgi:hypothetical protein